MDKLTFIAEMTKALAWPVVVAMVALIARKPVSVLLEGLRLQKLKAAGWEFEFGKLEAKVQARVAELPKAKAEALALPPNLPDADSLGAMVQGWLELERPVLEAARERFGDKAGPSFGVALNQLLQAGIVTPGTADALQGLYALRNLAVHAPDDKKLAERAPHFLSMSQAMRWTLQHELGSTKP